MVNLASPNAASIWGQLELFKSRWRDIDALVSTPGPFIQIASRARPITSVEPNGVAAVLT